MIIEIRHHFDAAHRLPDLPGKCQSLHGHTWNVRAQFAAPMHLNTGIAGADFSVLKKGLRWFLDTHFDHGALLDADDQLARVIGDTPGCKVHFVNGAPTVERITSIIAGYCRRLAAEHGMDLVSVSVDEGTSNTVTFSAADDFGSWTDDDL